MTQSSKVARNGSHHEALSLELAITDGDVVKELQRHEGQDRHDFACLALKVGVLSVRQACGEVDAKRIHDECGRFLEAVNQHLLRHTAAMTAGVAETLKRYFDPTGGELHLQIDKLVRGGGELESLLGRHLSGDGSVLTKTLERHVKRS